MSSTERRFITIVRAVLCNKTIPPIQEQIDWNALETLAEWQGLLAIVVDGIEKLPENIRPPKEMLLRWKGETLQGYEYRYELYTRTIAELATFYGQHGYKMMVLKGYACNLDWPKPEHRPCGDIDIWLFGQQKEADTILAKEKGVKVDASHHYHTVFNWGEFTVKNHYDFVNVHAHSSCRELEKAFKELGQDDTNPVEVYGEKVYLPSPNLHALFLMRYMVSRFVDSNIILRQVLDWAFFVEKHTKEINWEWLLPIVDEYHMRDFYNCINAICVEDLGFPVEVFKTVQFVPELKERVLNDILYPEFETKVPKMLIQKIIFKYRRWQGNAWKQRMCYNESRWSSFGTGVWAKIIKPASI